MKSKYIYLIFIVLLFCIGCNSTNNITVNYIYENEIIESISYSYNDSFKEIDYFLEDMVFNGYYLDSEYKEKIDVLNYKITKSQNIYLKYNKHKQLNIVYIPLDDRPVNNDRVLLLAKSLNINLIMPSECYYKTHLDNQTLNQNNSQIGNPEEILKFIINLDINNIDAFVLSIDQLLSGGLVGSRSNHNTELINEEIIIDNILNFTKEKPLYLIDTIMRLAPTVGFLGNTLDDYMNIYNYACVDRLNIYKSMPNEKNDNITIENVIETYNIDSFNKTINYEDYRLTDSQYVDYINARTRKLKLSDMILSKLKDVNTDKSKIHYICGIDDSSLSHNIQKNEINYLKSNYQDMMILAGVDQLGLMSISKVYQDLNNYKKLKVKINVFGENYTKIENSFDGISIKENLESHLNALNIEYDYDNKTQNNLGSYDFEILILTNEQNQEQLKKSSLELTNKLKENNEKKILTCIIDTNGTSSKNKLILSNDLIYCDLSNLIGYSCWNTCGNSIGIALSLASSRISYLKSDNSVYQSLSNEGFIESLVFGLVKDIGYKAFTEDELSDYINKNTKDKQGNIVIASNNFYQYLPYNPDFNIKLEDLMFKNANKIVSSLIGCDIYTSLKNKPKVNRIKNIEILNYHFPWYRTFEISFDIRVQIN